MTTSVIRSRRQMQLCVLVVATSCLIVGQLVAVGRAQAVPGSVTVSLTFDDGLISQYNLAYAAPNGLRDRGVPATFFVNSGTIAHGAGFMTWAQVANLAATGNDIGGKSVSSMNLTTDPDPTTQVCQDAQSLVAQGLTPVGFAYPAGASNATIQGIVQSCGYGNARSAGGLNPGTTGASAESLPPANWLATRAYAPAAVTLANLQSLVTNANAKGGGWVQIVIRRVCDQTLDAANYASCSTSSGRVELAELQSFLAWVQGGGAPAGTTFASIRQPVYGADNVAPTTTIRCNNAACAPSPYPDGVTVTLPATDLGSGVASTHYTTDGSDPTLASPTYTGPFGTGAQAITTIKYRSWDRVGNAGAIGSQTIQGPVDGAAPQTTIACNGAPCTGSYVGSVSVTLTAVDTGGSGVDKTYFTVDGSTPTTSSARYTGPFPLGVGTTTVKFFSVDFAGNAETAQSQPITVVPPKTIVSLTFDDGTASQYNLAYLNALQPHAADASFFVNSGTVGTPNFVSWQQLSALQSDGNDVGGKTTNGVNLTSVDQATATQQVCGDRQTLVSHGLAAQVFAYPNGAFNASVQAVVRDCGYGNARRASGLSVGTPNSGTTSETLPPVDWLATRSYAPSAVTAPNMQSIVSNTSAKGGGWVQIVVGKVCDQTLDPGAYTSCIAASGHIELGDLNSFLNWLANRGQSGGAPAGTVLETVTQVARMADAVAPTTSASCNGVPCSSTAYQGGAVTVALRATDLGSGTLETRYSLDGSEVSPSSPRYQSPLTLGAGTTVLRFRSWDNAGNAEPTTTLTIDVEGTSDTVAPSTSVSCNAAPCAATAYDGGITVTLTATDNPGGIGVATTIYTIDGSDPTASPTAKTYSGPFLLANNTTLRFFSTDLAGNRETVQTQSLFMNPYPVTVSLTFDDQYQNLWLSLRPLLQKYTMNATIYVITSDSYSPFSCCMSFSQLRTLRDEGNDVGGHGQFHLDLTDPSTTLDQKTADVCQSRSDLIANGISDPTSYAYPFGRSNATAASIVRGCGFGSSRVGGGISSSTTSPGPPWAESIPPRDPYAIRAIDVDGNTDKKLEDLQNFVTAAAIHGGGWMPMIFHQVCNENAPDFSTCIAQFGVRDTVLDQFMGWLQRAGLPGGAPAGASVRTMSQVLAGPDAQAPTTSITCSGSPCADWYGGPVQVRFDAVDTSGSGVDRIYYTTDGSTPTTSSPVYTGPFSVSESTTVRFFATDRAGNHETPRSRTIGIDGAPPTSAITCDGGACAGGWSTAAVEVALSATDAGGSGVDTIYYTTDGSLPTTASPVYSGPFSVSESATVRFFATDVVGNAETPQSQDIALDSSPPTSAITCDGGACAGGWSTAAVEVALSATDAGGSGVDTIYYTTDGSLPTTASPVYSGPFSVSQSTTVRFFATDHAGNAETPQSQDIRVDTTAPVSSISCDPGPCSGGAAAASIEVALSATDAGGAGVDTIYYTTDGSLPTTASPVYSGPFSVSESTTVRFFATDVVGNAETPQSQDIGVDSSPPTSAITCGGTPCSAGWYLSAVTVALSASDAGGSGVDAIYFTTDGSVPTTASPVYSGLFSVSESTTVRFFATDHAGNAEAPHLQAIAVDATAPTVTVACDGATCASWYRTSPVNVTLGASDSGGSGVDTIYFTTDGSAPTTASPIYSGPIEVTQATTIRFFATDVAGNAGTPQTQLVRFDLLAPTTSITCNGKACGAGWFNKRPVTIALSASDDAQGSGVSRIFYTTDGSTPTSSSTPYTAPFSISQNGAVRFFATDVAGNAEPPKSQFVGIDTSAPTAAISCNGGACSSGWYRTTPVNVTLTATDSGGSGVANLYYTTNGSTPTTSSPVYSTAIGLTQTTTVKVLATDTAGNASTVTTRTVQIDTAAPTVSMTQPAAGASIRVGTKVAVSASASDVGTGSGAPSGVVTVAFYLDGSTLIATDSSSPYSVTWNTAKVPAGTHALTAVASDAAGNSTTSAARSVTITP